MARKYDERVNIKIRVDAVKAHALKNYEKRGAGWDLVIETMDDWDIAHVIEGSNNAKGAIWKMAAHNKPYAEMRDEIQSLADY